MGKLSRLLRMVGTVCDLDVEVMDRRYDISA